jgi:hypothetical protein
MVANYPQMPRVEIGGITGSKLSGIVPVRKVGNITRGFKQTDFFLDAHTFSMVSESWRNPFVAPSVSGIQLRNPC